MKFKSIALAATIALAGPAFASTTTFNSLALGSATNFGGSFGSVLETDTFNFNLSTPAAAAVSVFNLSIGSFNQITGFSATLNGQALALNANTIGNIFSIPIALNSFTGPGAPASSFSLQLSGKGPAVYSGTFVVSSVPEPGSLALMLAGLGVVGFVAARRRKSN